MTLFLELLLLIVIPGLIFPMVIFSQKMRVATSILMTSFFAIYSIVCGVYTVFHVLRQRKILIEVLQSMAKNQKASTWVSHFVMLFVLIIGFMLAFHVSLETKRAG